MIIDTGLFKMRLRSPGRGVNSRHSIEKTRVVMAERHGEDDDIGGTGRAHANTEAKASEGDAKSAALRIGEDCRLWKWARRGASDW